ncbi:aspartate aminotransferase family protein [Actinokineospora sp. G85]|uniref:aspartate aminotransferase family protein n=1 Tax=Actinokineospora sp. G85 TaxID=3406626 RepID=UPI003C723C2C
MAELDLAEPLLLGWLSSVSLDAHYVRASGDYLYRLDDNGDEVPVVDFAGGYGSLLLGHNHPELVACAQRMLAEGTPIHAQFSRHPYASELAARLDAIVRRETGTETPYSAIFANSGAEAVEAAVKHAEFDRVARCAALLGEVAERVAAVDAAAVTVPAEVARAVGAEGADTESVLAALSRRNAEVAATPPLLLALEGGFHGKLLGSVQLTHNPAYRTPFTALGGPVRFVAAADLAALPKVFEEERVHLLDVEVVDGVLRLAPLPLPVFTAFLVEPVQGEGGIRVLDRAAAERLRTACAAAGCPVVVDEVQSGMGRTGTFLASSAVGLRGDYYALAKSLGGGLAKAAVMLASHEHYRPEFELVHSSTFAKDAFSTTIALKVVELLEADGGALVAKAAERGEHILAELRRVREEFPDVVVDVRGRGLMLGLEFADQSTSDDAELRAHAEGGTLGYALAGSLLSKHRVRTFPTASAPNTLRFEPSVHIGDAEVRMLVDGLRAVCAALRAQDYGALLG